MTGLDLNQQFFEQHLAPLLASDFPDLSYAAARLGDGSDVLGYDDEMSTDHDWGIRMQLFLSEEAHGGWATAVHEQLRRSLPPLFQGVPVHFGEPNKQGVRLLEERVAGPVDHRIEIWTLRGFFKKQLAIDPYDTLDAIDWLTIPQQLLLSVTKGRVFHDPEGALAQFREKFAYFPKDVWLYLMASQWGRISQEEHLMGRAGVAGDELGSRLIGARLVRDVMMLCFLQERTYAPYAKWFGTAFAELENGRHLLPVLNEVLNAPTWQERETTLCKVFERVATIHNGLGLTEPVRTECVSFYERPFRVLFAGDIQSALKQQIIDPTLQTIATNIGSIDQLSDSTDLLSYPDLHRALRTLYL